MKKSSIVQIGDPILRTKAKRVHLPLKLKDKSLIRKLVAQMRAHDLVGISAPQLGVSVRMYVSEVRPTKTRQGSKKAPLQICINPTITERSSRVVGMYEGCGSILHGELFAQVPRHTWVRVEYTDERGARHSERMSGLLGQIAQHEIDHLDGILFVDRVVKSETYIARELYKRAMKKKR